MTVGGYPSYRLGKDSVKIQSITMRFCIWAFCSVFFVQLAAPGQTEKYLGPCDLVPSKDGATLYVASADANQVIFLDIQGSQINRAIDTPHRPTGLTLRPDGNRLYVTCAAAKSAVLVIDADRGVIQATISVGHTACGPAISPDGERLYVCNRFDNDISVIDLKAGRETARVRAVREPLAAAVTPDGKSVLVINHLPAEPADTSDVAAVVTIVNTRTKHAAAIRLPAGASGLRDVRVCPDGKYAYVTHILARYELPTTQVDYGWMNANALSIIDVEQKELLGTVLLDDKYLGAANPWGVACSDDGKWVCVTHAGTHEISVIDAPALLEKLLAHKTPPAMSSGVRASAEAAVRGGIEHILFAEASEQDAAAIDAYLKSLQATASPYLQDGQLSPAAQRGKKLFFSGKVGCAECHPASLYTDMKRHDVGSKDPCDRRRAFDTPTLIEVWRTAPYLHDGRYRTIKELITERKHCRQQSEVALSERQIHDLIAFVLSL